MLKKLSILFILFLSLLQLYAVPADTRLIELIQSNGSYLSIRLNGDEFYHWVSTSDGYTLLLNSQKLYEYAFKNSSGDIELSGVLAKNIKDRTNNDSRYLKKVAKGLIHSVQQRQGFQLKGSFRTSTIKRGSFPSSGENKLIMILTQFLDTEPLYNQADFYDFMNTPGGNSGNGSFKDFYLEDSYGLLAVTTTVTAWVTLPHTREYYANKGPDFAYDAVRAADAIGIDFSEFDNDKDGYVDGIAIIHTGKGQESSGDSDDIWSHSWGISAGGFSENQRTIDGVVVDAYTVQPECYGTAISTIGVMCHEFGHNLGAPDFYDTNYETDGSYVGTGKWDLMAGGSWNGLPAGSSPSHTNMYQKIANGWVTPTVIEEDGNFSLKHAALNQEAYIYYSSSIDEYFLLENRQKYGFDRYLPGHGLLIYHVDEYYIFNHLFDNTLNASSHQGIYPKSASGSVNSSGCPFPGSGQKTKFDDLSSPNSITWNGLYTIKPLHDIVESDSVISFYIDGLGLQDPIWESTISWDNYLELNWSSNSNNDSVMLIWSYEQNFPILTQEEWYDVGHVFENGAKVLFVGKYERHFNHEEVAAGEKQYYKIYSKTNNLYSSGRELETQLACTSISSIPFETGFELNHTYGPGDCWGIMQNTFADGGIDGNNLQNIDKEEGDVTWFINTPENPDKYNRNMVYEGANSIMISADNTDLQWLISPEVYLYGNYANLEFYLYYEAYGQEGYRDTKFHVLIFANNEWTSLKSWFGEEDNLYEHKVKVYLDEYLNQNVRIAFVYEGNNSYPLAFDKLKINGGEGERKYDVRFLAIHEEDAIEGVAVSFNGQNQFTNEDGYVYFSNVSKGNEISFLAEKEGYNNYQGFADINEDIDIILSMHPLSINPNPVSTISAFPNPVDDEMVLVNENEVGGQYAIFNYSGQKMKQGYFYNKNTVLDLSYLSDGLYYLQLSSIYTSQNIKFVKQ